jgi:predicted nucleic acid-binding Zn ribbon protein
VSDEGPIGEDPRVEGDLAAQGDPVVPGIDPLAGIDFARQILADAQRGAAAKRLAEGRRQAKSRRHREQTRAANLRADRAGYSGPGPDPRDPQPAGAVLRGMLGEMGWQRPLTEARLFTDWSALVGAEVAAHCRPESLRDGELRIAAQSTAWATQIRLLSGKLVHRLNGQLGATVVLRVVVSGPTGPSWRHGPRSVPGARGPRDTYG